MALVSARLVVEALEDGDCTPTPTQQACCNRVISETWDSLRYFLGFHFKFNTRFDTPYWKAARAKTDLGYAAPIVEYFKQNGPSTYGRTALLGAQEHCGMEGYLCMLVGQRVSYKTPWTPAPAELAIWDGVRAEHRARALTGVTVEEALRVIARDNYPWDASWVRPPEPAERSAPVPGALGDVFV